jgi:hypothetical protein
LACKSSLEARKKLLVILTVANAACGKRDIGIMEDEVRNE